MESEFSGICWVKVITKNIVLGSLWTHFMHKRVKPAHCVKSVQIRSFFWSVFSCTWTEYGDLRMRYNLVFSPNAGKYGPEKTSYLDTFHIVAALLQMCYTATYFSNFSKMFRTPRGHLVSAGSSRPDVFCEKGVLRNLAKFTKSCNLIKK